MMKKPLSIEALNLQFSIPDQLHIEYGKGNFPVLIINNEHARATISLYGAQVLSYQPNTSAHDLLYVSPKAFYESGKAIKGGIPLCWPWFGSAQEGCDSDSPSSENRELPAHGFARNQLWELSATRALPDGGTAVSMTLYDTEQSAELWSFSFRLRLKVVIGARLSLALQTLNHDVKPFTISQALHSYFAVGDSKQVQLNGLEALSYLDKTQKNTSEKVQQGAVTINEEVDRIYQQSPAELYLRDAAWQREINIRSIGSQSTVVWNPWSELSAKSVDLTDDAYQHFLCVETNNADSDSITLEPEQSHTLAVSYTLSDL